MKQCDKLWDSFTHQSPQDKPVFEWGWEEALKWVKRDAISSDKRGDSSRNVINRELDVD